LKRILHGLATVSIAAFIILLIWWLIDKNSPSGWWWFSCFLAGLFLEEVKE